jgi:hypothetical protein
MDMLFPNRQKGFWKIMIQPWLKSAGWWTHAAARDLRLSSKAGIVIELSGFEPGFDVFTGL